MNTFSKMMACFLFALLAHAGHAQNASYESGVHYEVISSDAVPAGLNEVTEFFWYGCGHCYAFEPLLGSWHERSGSDVVLRRAPAIWNDTMMSHARIFFAEQELGILDETHQGVFDAIHRQGKALLKEEEVLDFFAAQGVDAQTFKGALSSFGVDSSLRKSQSEQRGLRVLSVPSIVVNGKYLVSVNDDVRTHEEVLQVVDFLLALDG